MVRRIVVISIFVLLAQFAIVDARNQKILTWGDQGDGTYKNPVLKSDYSDPDILRHGDDFYLIASDFHFVGMQVLHSKDLVNWRIIGQVFHRLSMASKYDEMKGYGQGTWALALRYHNGEFYVFVCTPSEGLFMWQAKDPAGPWSETVTVKSVPRWEDPCPFWDDDGQAYLIHSQVGAGPLILHRMSSDGTQLLDEGKEIYRGPVAEGPKLCKRKGYYYISLPEGGVDTGWQTVLRARDIYGPYERREVFPKGSPHQGGWVELKNGETWFMSFKSTGYLGRICYLNPIRWSDSANGLSTARNTLTEKLWDSSGVIDVKMDTARMKDGQRAGFSFMSGSDFGWIGVGQENGSRKIQWNQGKGPVLQRQEVWFRGVYNGDKAQLLYSLDGKKYIDTQMAFRLAFRFWKGARIAIFSFGNNGGSADFDYVRYMYGGAK
jgi:beta-xylosidase